MFKCHFAAVWLIALISEGIVGSVQAHHVPIHHTHPELTRVSSLHTSHVAHYCFIHAMQDWVLQPDQPCGGEGLLLLLTLLLLALLLLVLKLLLLLLLLLTSFVGLGAATRPAVQRRAAAADV
jgi:hypothetical protein